MKLKILLVLCHPRLNSLSSEVADAFKKGVLDAGHIVEFLDLYREGFNPILEAKDEPKENGLISDYSNEVQNEFSRLNRNNAIVLVFPLWWWTMPAMLKGWIDRVWNYGLTYGPAKHQIKKLLIITLSGEPIIELRKSNYEGSIRKNLLGIGSFNNILDSKLVILDNTISGEEYCKNHIKNAYSLGLKF